MYISDRDHEELYGDKKLAQEMVRQQLAKKMYCNLRFLNVRMSKVSPLTSVNYKKIQKMTNPEWPRILELATKSPMALNFKSCGLTAKDCETLAFMLADNPFGESKITSLALHRCPIRKEGAKLLGPALKANASLTFLNLSSC